MAATGGAWSAVRSPSAIVALRAFTTEADPPRGRPEAVAQSHGLTFRAELGNPQWSQLATCVSNSFRRS